MKITVDGVAREVSIEPAGKGFVVTVEGRRYPVSDVSVTTGTLAFLINRQSHVAHVSKGEAGVLVSIDGRTHTLTRDEVDADRPAGSAGHGDGRLEAPMPGSIVAVKVAVGDPVHTGQPVVVLESMKMHNEIVATMDGVVKKVHCRAGDQVPFGYVLAEIGADRT
jgi:3-methylcrotonyl-CoA carboxylase alpha subunit